MPLQIALAAALLAGLAAAQQTPAASSPATQQNSNPAAASPPAAPTPQDAQEGHERILGVVPAFSVTNHQDAPPLTPKQKLTLWARQSFDPFEWFAAGLEAGISQSQNEFPSYGQGVSGYSKRYAASMADAVDSGFMANFLYPVLLKEDPRYFRLGHGKIRHRIVYSLEQEFSSKTDKGARDFNYSNVLGAFTTGAVSNIYYPPSDRGFSLTMSRSAISLLYGMVGGLGVEFWPDVDRKLFHRHPKAE